jgi:hypothetical protein
MGIENPNGSNGINNGDQKNRMDPFKRMFGEEVAKAHFEAEQKIWKKPVKTEGNGTADTTLSILGEEDLPFDEERMRKIFEQRGYTPEQIEEAIRANKSIYEKPDSKGETAQD